MHTVAVLAVDIVTNRNHRLKAANLLYHKLLELVACYALLFIILICTLKVVGALIVKGTVLAEEDAAFGQNRSLNW